MTHQSPETTDPRKEHHDHEATGDPAEPTASEASRQPEDKDVAES